LFSVCIQLILFHRSQKKFWVEVKPSGCPEKKLFMVIHDDGVAATANPESATFPDSCEVSLHMPDADLLHKKEGIIVGVRHPVTQQYQVQLQDEQIRNAFGRMIVRAGEDSLRWRNQRGNSSSAAKAYSNDKELPTRPYIPPKNASDFTSPTPNTKATGYGPPLSVNLASPVIQRRQLASADSSNCITASGGGAALILSECNESNPSSFARMQKSPTKVIFNVPQPAALAHSEAPAISSPESFALPQPTSSKRYASIACCRFFCR
jgi:hypothetical protein